ncbi:MAG: DUF6196 family protein [Allosphingosinicella sp.]
MEIETPARTEARLRGVLRAADVEILKPSFAWEDIAREAFPAGINVDALALAQDGEGWSQLIPVADPHRADTWALAGFHFSPRANTDGFTDWLASYLRRRVGPKVMIASGFNNRTGASYLYWGVPSHFREALVRELAILSTPPMTGVRAVGLL